MEMNRRPAIDGKVVIVTGASSGIGESTPANLLKRVRLRYLLHDEWKGSNVWRTR
jgi:NAD(P)-dependent dehydrogenase (short-subunit alcohol dehydrogenase family)